MKKDKNKINISKENIRVIKAKVRRALDLEDGVGINRHHTVTKDKKKELDKKKCRNKTIIE